MLGRTAPSPGAAVALLGPAARRERLRGSAGPGGLRRPGEASGAAALLSAAGMAAARGAG